jgi:hypothetical protein
VKTRPKKEIIGTCKCLVCERDIPAKQSETGTLDVSCQWCEFPAYAKAGTEAHRRLMERVIRTAPAASDPEPEPPPAPPQPKQAAKATRSVFDVLGVSR